ncbi:hypothetical protein OESDEN_17122 [Oesophagostomum dentatum]|uniref:BEN domain-containing protein n=1 Tax=Oesophagostomum dentatum TaxID=61180 RepID=A0A0B1SH36_OESDE|nr:hypothetical protein OESDEN_17122 [Oesophagostomum dentatum]
MENLLFSFNSTSRQILSRLEDLESTQLEVEHLLKCNARVGGEIKDSVATLKSSTAEILSRVPSREETPPALCYPYRVSKEKADAIQLRAVSATMFARIVERELFKNDEDKDECLENRASQDKVQWLRQLVKYRYPSKNGIADETTWNACRKGINEYHRKQRNRLATIFPNAASPLERSPSPDGESTSAPVSQDSSVYSFHASTEGD